MSRRATIVAAAITFAGGLANGIVVYPRLGLWALVDCVPIGVATGWGLAAWDKRTGAAPWWPWRRWWPS